METVHGILAALISELMPELQYPFKCYLDTTSIRPLTTGPLTTRPLNMYRYSSCLGASCVGDELSFYINRGQVVRGFCQWASWRCTVILAHSFEHWYALLSLLELLGYPNTQQYLLNYLKTEAFDTTQIDFSKENPSNRVRGVRRLVRGSLNYFKVCKHCSDIWTTSKMVRYPSAQGTNVQKAGLFAKLDYLQHKVA